MTMASTTSTSPAAAGIATPARTPALKEWRSVCRAILEGEQIITLRKGGIREKGRRFEVEFERFVLFPTLEHQAEEYLKPAYGRYARRNIAPEPEAPNLRPGASVVIEGYCDVARIFKITEERYLDALDSMHIWKKQYVLERLRWKSRQPLYVVALRSYILSQAVEIPVIEAYGGCKSWVELEAAVPLEGEASLSDKTFEAKLAAVEEALA